MKLWWPLMTQQVTVMTIRQHLFAHLKRGESNRKSQALPGLRLLIGANINLL